MARYVIDARTLLHIVADELDVDAEHQLVAPNVIRSHALALLLADVQQGHITEDVALRRHERLTELKMRLLGDRVSRRTAWKIARTGGTRPSMRNTSRSVNSRLTHSSPSTR